MEEKAKVAVFVDGKLLTYWDGAEELHFTVEHRIITLEMIDGKEEE